MFVRPTHEVSTRITSLAWPASRSGQDPVPLLHPSLEHPQESQVGIARKGQTPFEPEQGEFVIERPLSGDPAPLPPNPIPSKLLAYEKRDCIAGARAGRTGHSPGNWRNPGRSR